MNKVQPFDCSSIEQSESASVTDEPEGEDEIPSAMAPPIPKVQGLIDESAKSKEQKGPEVTIVPPAPNIEGLINDLEDVNENSTFYHLSTLSGPIMTLAVISAECFIPFHNVLKEPQYWYEHQLILTFGLIPLMFGNILSFAIYWANFTFEKKWISYVEMIAVGSVTFLVALTAYYLVWTEYLGYFQPLPVSLIVTGYPTLIAMIIFTGYRLYSAQNKPSNLNERFAWFCGLNFGVVLGVTSTYPLLGTAFSVVPKKYQWILALITPLVREFWVWIGAKVAFKASGTNKASTKYICQQYMETKHAVFLAVILGGVATTESTYCILALDFAINLYQTIRIITSGALTNEKKQEKINDLVMTERNETLIPLVYMIALLMAYYGPNAEILASIKLKIWHYQTTITNIEESIFNIGILWVADLLSLIVTAALIWKYCKINVYKNLLQLQKKLWFPMAVCEGLLMVDVFVQLAIGSGQDLTLQFDWIDGKYALNSTST